MDKKQALQSLQEQIKQNNLSKEEVLSLFEEGGEKETNSSKLINILYGIGSIIAIIGVVILIAENWDTIGFLGRVLVTMGLAILTYLIGFKLKGEKHRNISQVMFAISAALSPLGIYVILREISDSKSWLVQVIIALSLAAIFALTRKKTQRNILAVAVMAYLSWAYFVAFGELYNNYSIYSDEIIKSAVALWGVFLIGVGVMHTKLCPPTSNLDLREKESINQLFYGFGTLMILIPSISTDGIFDLITLILVLGGFYLSIFLKSRAMLVFSALFLVGHIIKLTGEYFVDSVGWPVSLIAMGFIVIGIGYGTFRINRKYLSR